MSKTLSLYLFRLYCQYFLSVLLVFSGILLVLISFDVLQKFRYLELSARMFFQLIFLKLPYFINEISGLTSFISGLLLFKRLTHTNELLIIMSVGVSITRIMLVLIVSTLLVGIAIVCIINPIGCYGLKQFKKIERQLLNSDPSEVISSESGLLFIDEVDGENKIIQTKFIDLKAHTFNKVVILFFNSQMHFLKRIDANNGVLKDGFLRLHDVRLIDDVKSFHLEYLDVSTNLSLDVLRTRLISPEMVSIWRAPDIIAKFMRAGLPVLPYQMRYYKQLLQPLIMVAMLTIAACFINLRQRDRSNAKIFMQSILIGVAVYVGLEFSFRVLVRNEMQPFFAVFLPPILIILINHFVILHFRES